MGNFVWKNWKMTLAGIITAVANLVVAYLEGTLDTKTFLVSAAIAILGVIGKDADVTGTKELPREWY